MVIPRPLVMGIVLALAAGAAAERREGELFSNRAPRQGLDAAVVYGAPVDGPGVRFRTVPPPALSETSSAKRFRSRLKRVLRGAKLGDVRVGLVVHDLESRQDVARMDYDGEYNPASTLKLFTSAVALDRLGPEHRFSTELLVVDDTVILKGDGDPMLTWQELQSLVSRASVGLRQSGPFKRILVDDSQFTGGDLPPGFGQKNTDASYRAATGAVALDFGTARFVVTPTREGRPPSVEVIPPGYVQIDNRARTVGGKGSTIQIKTRTVRGRTVAKIIGGIGRNRATPAVSVRRIARPPTAAGYALRQALRAAGHSVQGPIERGVTPAGARVLARRSSQPLSKLIAVMNKHSNNFIAEMLLRAIPKSPRASWDDGKGIVRTWLIDRAGIPGAFRYRNGSGLYDGGRFTPRQVVALLAFMNDHPERELWRASLAGSGGEGTLYDRLRSPRYRGRIIGKTGTLNDVSALSGYVRGRSGRLYAFSILMNDTNEATTHMRRTQDRILALAADLL